MDNIRGFKPDLIMFDEAPERKKTFAEKVMEKLYPPDYNQMYQDWILGNVRGRAVLKKTP